MARIPIVDKNDKFLYYKERKEVDIPEIVQTSALWVENSKGEILLAQRAFTLRGYPGIWGVAVTGTVDEGETYEDNVVKEAEEEIGLTNFKYKIGPKFYIEEQLRYKFCQYFITSTDWAIENFKIDQDAVAEIKWVNKAWLFEDVVANHDRYTPSLLAMVNNLKEKE